MNTERKFVFTDASKDERLPVTVPETVEPDYSMYTWPCAPVLAQYIWYNRDRIYGKTMLEIGAGTALPSLVAKLCGAVVKISDRPELSSYLRTVEKSFHLNGVSTPHVHYISWGKFNTDLFHLPHIDILLASDCFYDTNNFEDILVTVAYILHKNPDCEFWCSYQERSSSRSIEFLLEKWRLKCKSIPLTSFNADGPSIAQSDLPGDHTIHMYIMEKKHF